MSKIRNSQYERQFEGFAAKALDVALEARRFEIQMYWTRTAYFWALSGAALAGFFLLSSEKDVDRLFSFAICCIGFVLAFGWALANKGSKYWHENWEHHVQLLEDQVIGPLHKTIIHRPPEPLKLRRDFISQILTGPSGFSVSKINSIFSWFFCSIWISLGLMIAPMAKPCESWRAEWRYIIVFAVSVVFCFLLLWIGRSWNKSQQHNAYIFRSYIV